LESRFQSVIHRARRYCDVLSHLNTAQLAQVLEDKLDGKHSIRRRFTSRRRTSLRPVILLPSAYVNVSRTALAYAELLPDHQFLLVLTRSNAKLPSLPANVRLTSLSPYFVSSNQREIACLIESWNGLRKQLVIGAGEFSTADQAGVLEPALRIRECDRLPQRRRQQPSVEHSTYPGQETRSPRSCLPSRSLELRDGDQGESCGFLLGQK
jgi:hypothetical protein